MQAGEGRGNFAALQLDEVEEFRRGAGILIGFGVGIDSLQIVALGFDGGAFDRPTERAIGTDGERSTFGPCNFNITQMRYNGPQTDS